MLYKEKVIFVSGLWCDFLICVSLYEVLTGGELESGSLMDVQRCVSCINCCYCVDFVFYEPLNRCILMINMQ